MMISLMTRCLTGAAPLLILLAAFRPGAHGADAQGLPTAPRSYFRGEPMRIGNQVQFVLDDYIVEDRWKLTRRVGNVIKHMRNPVVVQDKPWEDAVGGSPSVLYDDKMHKFRMWYTCFNLSNYFSKQGPAYYTAYAESDDAYNWTKPRLEGFPFGDHNQTNIVMTGRGGRRASGSQVFLNQDQSDPQRRFMMLHLGGSGIDLAYSPDGFRWTVVEKPLLSYHSDCPNHLLWIPEERAWYMYVRSPIRPNGMGPLPEGLRHTGRRVALTTSSDLKNWSMPRTVMYPDERDQPDYDGASPFRRHGLFVMLYSMMFQETGNSENELHVATSRDGVRWERTWDRKPFVPRGPEGAFDHSEMGPGSSAPLEIGNDMLFYYYASPNPQGDWFKETSVGLCRIRKDRFVGQWAGQQTGYLLTRQFILEGSKLLLNCTALPRAYQGAKEGIKVEILQAPDFKMRETTWETAVPGFTRDDCDRIQTDSIAHIVTWHGKSDLTALKGRAIYLRFEMKSAGLYTFQIAP